MKKIHVVIISLLVMCCLGWSRCIVPVQAEETKREETTSNSKDPLIVAVYQGGLPPFSFDENSSQTGIYLDVLDEVLKIMKIPYKKQYYPYARIAAVFTKGSIDIDPGNSPDWIDPASKDVSVFTLPFMQYQDAILTREGQSFTLDDIKGKKVGVIRGYYYPPEYSALGYIPDFAINEEQQFRKFQGNRYDYFITSVTVAKYYSKLYHYPFQIGATFTPVPISFRLRVKHKQLAGKMDAVITKLVNDGTIEAIMKKYTE